MSAALEVRRAEPHEFEQIIDVCAQALSWRDDDPNEAFFRWKHVQNPFGASPVWIAIDPDDSAIVGVRAMMRWEFRHVAVATPRTMVRAVDTATLPTHQGRGIFRTLTTRAVEELTSDGVSAVFNTPNDKSRPGYLKMGWVSLGRPMVRVHPRSPGGLLNVVRSRVAGEKWGEPTDVGQDPAHALRDTDAIDTLLSRVPDGDRWSTPLSAEYLRWRTGFEPLRCRIAFIDDDIERGLVVFRVRRRGDSRQLSVLHVLAGPGARPARTIRRLVGATEADVALHSGPSFSPLTLPVPGAGPIVTWRALADPSIPDLDVLDLSLGAIELF